MSLYSIAELAAEFDVSTRTIRYYEELELLHPISTRGRMRMYGRKERTRLRLILRGKRFGFSLAEIKTMIDRFEEDRTGRKQLEQTITYGIERIAEINERISEMTALRDEMELMLTDLETKLKQLN